MLLCCVAVKPVQAKISLEDMCHVEEKDILKDLLKDR